MLTRLAFFATLKETADCNLDSYGELMLGMPELFYISQILMTAINTLLPTIPSLITSTKTY